MQADAGRKVQVCDATAVDAFLLLATKNKQPISIPPNPVNPVNAGSDKKGGENNGQSLFRKEDLSTQGRFCD